MARDKPQQPADDRTKMVQMIDLEYHNSMPDGSLVRNRKKIDRGEQCYFASPMDFPAYVRFTRTVESEKEGTSTHVNVKSITAELDLYPAGIKVFVKWDKAKQQFVLMTQERDGKAKVAARYPTTG